MRELADRGRALPKAIQERLGLSSITMTLDSYGHLLPGLGNALADALDAAYAGASLSAASAPLRVLTSG
ncbi:MAG: hypothetical protein WKF33_06290 [Thermoleophilaceae bacterium]